MAREFLHVYDLHIAFGCFFHVARFRHVQALTGAIITGSRALAFMGLYEWVDGSNLDIVVSVSGVARLITFLVSEGYDFLGDDALDVVVSRLEAMLHVVNGVQPLIVLAFKRVGAKINVLVAACPLECILDFPCSTSDVIARGWSDCIVALLMNGISWNCAFSLFPRATFLNRRGLITGSLDRLAQVTIAKYRARGFRAARDWVLVGGRDLDDFLPMRTRRVGDDGCWMLYFDAPVHPIPQAVHRVEWNTFRVLRAFVGSHGQLRASAYRLDVATISSPLLSYQYTVPLALWEFAGGVLLQLERLADDLGWDGELVDFLLFVRL